MSFRTRLGDIAPRLILPVTTLRALVGIDAEAPIADPNLPAASTSMDGDAASAGTAGGHDDVDVIVVSVELVESLIASRLRLITC